MKCQGIFSEKNKKNVSNCCPLKFLPSMLSVNNLFMWTQLLLRWGHHMNIFLIVPEKHILLILIRSPFNEYPQNIFL